jgi:hypothetical protein
VPPRAFVVVQAAGQLHGEVIEALLGVPEHVLDAIYSVTWREILHYVDFFIANEGWRCHRFR